MSLPLGYYDESLPPELWEAPAAPPVVGAAARRGEPDEQVELEVAVGEPGEQGVVESDPSSPIPGEQGVADIDDPEPLPELDDDTSSTVRTAGRKSTPRKTASRTARGKRTR